jgi:hypothetical protein
MNRLRPIELWDRGFESHSRHECLCVFILLWEVDVGSDNHVLIFCTGIYCHYAEYTDELQLDDLQVAG